MPFRSIPNMAYSCGETIARARCVCMQTQPADLHAGTLRCATERRAHLDTLISTAQFDVWFCALAAFSSNAVHTSLSTINMLRPDIRRQRFVLLWNPHTR